MKVSIITATYNSAATVLDTVKSVLSQNYSDIEYIIIDGNSKDGTMELLQPYLSRISRVVSEPDKGIYDAMNKGMALATGDIIGILNSDDFFTSDDVVESLVKEFGADSELQAVYGDVHFVQDPYLDVCVRYYSSAIFSPRMFRFGFMPAHPSFYMRRECFLKYGGYDLKYKIAADYEYLVRLIYRNQIKIKYLKKDFVTMRVGGVSTRNLKNRLVISREDVKACLQNGLYTNLFLVCFKYVYKVFEFRWWTNFWK